MLEMDTPSDADIPESVMLGRLAQSEQMREFFIQMWLQNPALAERAGRRVRELLAPARRPAGTDFSG
ncbi:MAG: hypothetical protein WC100_16925 [Sterolibacterium sp.]